MTTMLPFDWRNEFNLITPCQHPYALECVFLHTLLGMTAFHSLTIQFALHIFPSTILPYKQTRCALPERMRCTSRLGVSPSKGLPNLFHRDNSKSITHINKRPLNDLWIQSNLHQILFHNLTIRILHLHFSNFRLKGGG